MQQLSLFAGPSPPTPGPDARPNLVIEAGAGTGKTTAIVAEVVKLMLERPDLSPDRIVLMTFTEKAAGEIADRIRSALEELSIGLSTDSEQPVAWPVDSRNPLITITDRERARPAIEHHLANVDALRSQTIHSFCQSLLRTFPIEAGLDPQFKIVEGFEHSLLYGQVYGAWLDHETRIAPSDEVVREWETLFSHAGYLFQIENLVLELSERRDLLGETGYDFGDFEKDVVPRLTDALIWIRSDSASCKDAAAARVAEYVRRNPFSGGTLEDWIEYFQPIASTIRDIKLPGCGALKEPMVELRGDAGDSIYDRLAAHRAGMALVALTRRFLAYLDEEKRKLGVVDFDDLLLRTLALLDDEQVLARARAQFDFIFVDEFQDTDRTQARIIGRLARDASGRFVPGKTIVVGDPKQSIYGFRRADPETYHQMTKELVEGGAERRVISDQYRSDPALLEVVNAMFDRIFPEREHDPNVFRPAYIPLRAARAEARRDLDARVTILHTQHDDKADRHFAEAEAIAGWISRNRDGGPKDLQRFAILFRRLTVLDDYLETLRRRGIEYVLPPTRSFLDRRAPVDLLAVLRAIAYPFDRGAQISAARTPYFALTDVEIVNGTAAVSGDPSIADSGASGAGTPWAEFTASLAELRSASRHLTITQLIDLILSTTGIESVYSSTADGDRDLAHLERVRGIAFEYDQRIGGSVQQFVDEIAQRRSEPEEMEPSLVDETQNAVRIMTVHAAKGLEFDTVIIPDLGFGGGGGGLQLFTVEEPKSIVLAGGPDSISANFRHAGDQPLKKIARDRDEAEMFRLFYVAVTRARTDVVFVMNPKERKTGFQKALVSLLGDVSWPDEGREVRMTALGPIAFEKIDRPSVETAEDVARTDEGIVPWTNVVPEPTIGILSPAEIAARRAGSRNKGAGILLHRVLELWDGRSDAEPLLQQLAIEAAADAETVAKVRRRLATIARSGTLRRIARAETVGREVPVRFVEDGVLVERRIDRLIREGDREVVIDYKSGSPHPERVAKDRIQVTRYAEAITAMTGRPCDALLWYVDLESDALV
jgi:ATP-dependent helicase/nuclease subunit A